MDRMLGLQDSYVQRQFEMSGLELDRATNSSYIDMTRWRSEGSLTNMITVLFQRDRAANKGDGVCSELLLPGHPSRADALRKGEKWEMRQLINSFCADFEVLYNPRQRFHWSDCVSELSENSEHSLHHRHFCWKSQTEIFRKISFINNVFLFSMRINILFRIGSVWIWNWFVTVTRRTAVQTYFNNRANVDTYMTLLNL